MLRFLRASAENRRWNFSTAVAKSTTSPAMIFRQLVSVVPGPRVHEPPHRFSVRFRLRLCGQGQKKRSSPAQGALHLSLLRRCPRRKPTARVRARIERLPSTGEFFNFFLALEKICAYIRICRRVPKPQEKNPPAETGAAGNFRLGRTIFAKRGTPLCSTRESKLG